MLNSEYSEFSLPLSLMRALFFLGLIVLSAPIVWAQNAAVEALPPFLQSRVVDSDPLMDFRTQSVPQGRVDRDTGVLRAAYRLAPTVLLRATHEATARAYLDAEAERFGWATADDLLLVREIDGHYSAHLTFQQMFGGIPVHNRFVKVSMGPSGHPSMVLSGYAPHLRDAGPVRLQPLMDASGAVLRAQQEMRAQGVSTPELVVYPSVPPRLAWRMTTSPDGSVAEWEVLMDADTGEILYLMNQVMHMDTPSSVPASPVPLASASSAPAEPASVPVARAVVDGTGLVFDPDPLTSAGVPHGGAYMDYGDADVEELNAERKEVVLRDITLGADGLYRLIGPYVEITGEPSPYGTAWTPPAEADPDSFRYGRANDSFEAVMMYYHIDQNQRYIQSLDVGYPIGEYSIRVNPHGEGNTSRAVYYTRSRSLSFGDNGIDHAEDVDVILVVYGFALIDDIVSGLYYSSWEGEAVVRGWSLYWAASYSRWLAETGEVPAFQDWWRLLNWKSPGFGWPLDAPVGLRYPENTGCDDGAPCDPTGDGLLWATTMMEIYDELGKTVTDRLHLASFAYLSSPSTFFDAAEALLQADETLYSGQYRNILTERLATRGYLRVPLRLSVSPSTVAEEDAAVEVRVTATLDDGWMFPSAQPVTVNVGVPEDSAEEGTDYAAVSDFTITISSESSSATGTFMLNPTPDDIFEGSEIVSVEGSMTIAEPYGSEITITDDDVRSTALLLTINPKSVGENAGTVRLRVTASLNAGASTAPIAVTVSVTDGTADLGDDYRVRSNPSPLIIPAGKKSVTRTVELSVLEDDIEEDNETIVIGVSATGLTPASQDVTITANDASLSVTLGVSPPRVAENVGTAEVTVTATVDGGRTFAGAQTVTVSVGAQGDSAEEGTDYVAVSDFAITIPGGSSSATSSFTLDPVDNVIFEGDKTVGVSGALSRRTVTPTELTITDDDAASTALVLTISPESVEEDAGVISLGITASLDAGASTEVISVAVSVMDGTAGPSDYTTVSIPSPLKIPAGALEVTGTVELSILEDDVEEGEETVVIGASATGLTADSQEFTITDNDVLLPVTLGVSPPRVVENVETAEVTVTATVDGGTFAELMAVTISVGTLGDSAVEGTDYAVVEAFTITIPAGSASATSTFTLDPLDDNIAEGDETVSVEGTLSGRTVTPAQVTITDDDVPSTALALTLNPARLHEDSGTSWVRFTADLNDAARPMDTPVDVSVSGGTATAGADYSAPVIPTSIMIPAGETSISDSLQITVTDDDEVEGNETIVIGVSAPDLTGTMQDLVIIDNETAVRIDVLNVIAKDDGDYTITATVRQNLGAPVASVVLHYGDGMAFEMVPMQTLVMGSSSLYRTELMGPDEGGILYYYVVATNEDGLTARYPPDGRYWDISNYTDGSRLVLLDFEDGDASDKSAVRHYVAYKGGAGALAEGALALDGLDDHAEILGSSLGASEEFALELMFNADDFDAQALDDNEGYLVAKPARCSTCWEESTFSLLWGDDSGNSGTYVAARFWNPEYEGGQVELEIPLPLIAGQWYHAALEVQKKDAGQRAVLRLRDGNGVLYGEDAAVLPAPPAISTYPIFVGHIGDRGFFTGRMDDVAFYNYAHFSMLLSGAEGAREVPEGYVLEQNYPNPFNPVTTIRYDLAKVGHVRLEVSDLLGRRVALLVDGVQQVGAQEVRFDAGDLPSGMYLYRLRVEDFVSTKKMVLLK